MSDYDAVSFPHNVVYNATGGPTFKTDIITMSGGAEQRNASGGRHAIREFTIQISPMEDDLLEAVIDFFQERRGSYSSFRFRDPFDYIAIDEFIDRSVSPWQLCRRYIFGDAVYTRPIHKIDTSEVGVSYKLNGSPISPPGGTSLNTETGQLTWGGSLSGGDVLTWSGNFEIVARVADDIFDSSLVNVNARGMRINLIEVLDENPRDLASVSLPSSISGSMVLPFANGLNISYLHSTELWRGGYTEFRAPRWSAGGRRRFSGKVMLSSRAALRTMLDYFLAARGRLLAFAYDGISVRWATDELNLQRVAHNDWEADVELIEVV